MLLGRKNIDNDVLSKAIEYLEAPHEASWDLSNVPDYVLKPFSFFATDANYLKHYNKMQEKRITASQMSPKDIKTMFTFFSRGEHFSVGFTADAINSGELLGVYKRLEEIVNRNRR